MPEGATRGPYNVEAPEGTVSITIIADGGDTSDMDISGIMDPYGLRIVTDGLSDPIGKNLSQGYGQSTVAFTFPHSDSYSLKPGVWSFNITHYASPDGGPRDVSVYTIVKDKMGEELDVNVWIVAIPDYSGENDASLRKMLSEFDRLIKTAGVSLGDIKINVLSGPDAERLTILDINTDANFNGQPDDLDELFKFSSQVDNDYLNLFLVRSMGASVIGYAGGIPGPPLLQGTAHSGVAISTFGGLSTMSQADLVLQGATMAHEVGHYLGLFHTTEKSGNGFDPLSDTPECDRGVYDTDGDGAVSAAECSSADGPNLMFWSAASYPQEELTPAQSLVMRLFPAVR